ncbi:N-acetylmuramoyl-L-alanine amidase [Leptolyngbya sp. AN02str]|uniref:N-acetylmuramoyl-L-alanine amidase n=1 Tax=Leptolyngbya sp. AN02str TaxID=3423363 RepID=UPI003D31C108
MKVHWLASNVLGLAIALLAALPATANSLQSWQYSDRSNRLTFTTQAGVQPRAQLIFDPTRLVIDLPGVVLSGGQRNQPGGNGIREVRVGQVERSMARIVVELEPGYTLDPNGVSFRGLSPTNWEVQLPPLQRAESNDIAETSDSDSIEVNPPARTFRNRNSAPSANAPTQIQEISVTGDGFFIRTTGAAPRIRVRPERRDRRIVVELRDTALPARLLNQEEESDRFGVERIRYTQDDRTPPTTRIILELAEPNANWQASVSPLGGGIVLLPGRIATAPSPSPTPQPASEPIAVPTPAPNLDASPRPDPRPVSQPTPQPTRPAPAERPAVAPVITAIALSNDGASLQIQGSGPLEYTIEQQNNTRYRITFPNTQLARGANRIDFNRSSRILQLNAQENDGTVELEFELARDVQVRQLPEAEGRFGTRSPTLTIPLARAHWQPSNAPPPIRLQELRNRGLTIVLDPGHGGRDPGAVGIGGLQEIQVVNSVVPQVAALLEQAGARVVLTRTDNRTLDLEPRVRIAEQARATIFVSIHANAISMSRPDVNGIETFYSSARGQPLAQTIQDSLIEATGSPSRGARAARFYVIRRTSMPATLVELGFVTGAEDAPRMQDERYRALLAQAVARGILQYLNQNF